MSLIAFIENRIAMGSMLPVALSRANRAARHLNNESRRTLYAGRLTEGGQTTATGLPDTATRLRTEPLPFAQACAFVNMHHRHLSSPVGHLYAVGCLAGDLLVGVAIVGRPVARGLDDGSTVEVTRVATNGTRNACSMLLGAVRREAARKGYGRVITYTLPEESGASLRAAGFAQEGTTAGGGWSCPTRPREDAQRDQRPKSRWASPATAKIRRQARPTTGERHA